ncbi:hypothetical protein BO71DRAFT_91366 [Aspergillus ellipticus CBS 707.79]|uniref:Uncharacterized protein n=1 Tax=Aspergillus ellipticus CBS 707.79 TaxID=1448320 RepID=A0A319CZH7_9EURO|nr:hypothetical protein BO71DRAFT_91366 [Aspergillus ellipticus CBS 707.79]
MVRQGHWGGGTVFRKRRPTDLSSRPWTPTGHVGSRSSDRTRGSFIPFFLVDTSARKNKFDPAVSQNQGSEWNSKLLESQRPRQPAVHATRASRVVRSPATTPLGRLVQIGGRITDLLVENRGCENRFSVSLVTHACPAMHTVPAKKLPWFGWDGASRSGRTSKA